MEFICKFLRNLRDSSRHFPKCRGWLTAKSSATTHGGLIVHTSAMMLATMFCASALHAPLADRGISKMRPLPRSRTITALSPEIEPLIMGTFSVSAMSMEDALDLQHDVGMQSAWLYSAYLVLGKFTKPFIRAPIGTHEEETKSVGAVEYLPDGRSVSYESSFGWHHADLRTPLPPLSELTEHQIGVRDGKLVYLCTARKAVGYGMVERSRDFSEHYGVPIYVCQRH